MKRLARPALVAVFLGLLSLPAFAQGKSATLEQLRHDLAMRYLEPAPHMALAKFFHDRGERLQAFYLLEWARRGRFEEPVFDRAFAETFGRPEDDKISPPIQKYLDRIGAAYDKQPARAKALLAEAIARFPAEGRFRYTLAALLQREDRLDEAEAHFVKAAELSPRLARVQTWVGRFFYKVRRDHARALHYYLSAYFLDPHAYESEYVESRIRKINYEQAEGRLAQLLAGSASLPEVLGDANPTVAVMAVRSALEAWRPEYLSLMLTLMGHDDETVRWLATQAIKRHADRSFDEQLRALLRDADLRKRGLAAYLAVRLWKQESFPLVRAMLGEQAQLLRYDAVSALMLEGGPAGRRLLREHRPQEHHPALQKLIDNTAATGVLTNRDF